MNIIALSIMNVAQQHRKFYIGCPRSLTIQDTDTGEVVIIADAEAGAEIRKLMDEAAANNTTPR